MQLERINPDNSKHCRAPVNWTTFRGGADRLLQLPFIVGLEIRNGVLVSATGTSAASGQQHYTIELLLSGDDALRYV